MKSFKKLYKLSTFMNGNHLSNKLHYAPSHVINITFK